MKFFKNSDNKVVIWQTPNVPLVGWALFMVSTYIIRTDSWQQFAGYMSFGFIFTWAWLEITDGANYFRRTIGLIILLASLYSKIA